MNQIALGLKLDIKKTRKREFLAQMEKVVLRDVNPKLKCPPGSGFGIGIGNWKSESPGVGPPGCKPTGATQARPDRVAVCLILGGECPCQRPSHGGLVSIKRPKN